MVLLCLMETRKRLLQLSHWRMFLQDITAGCFTTVCCLEKKRVRNTHIIHAHTAHVMYIYAHIVHLPKIYTPNQNLHGQRIDKSQGSSAQRSNAFEHCLGYSTSKWPIDRPVPSARDCHENKMWAPTVPHSSPYKASLWADGFSSFNWWSVPSSTVILKVVPRARATHGASSRANIPLARRELITAVKFGNLSEA